MRPRSTHPEIDTTVAHNARIWNHWLGGQDNCPVDRELGEQIRSFFPEIADNALADRAFPVRTVTHLVRQEGIDQFLDIGTGLPTHNNTHEVAQALALAPHARVVHVDNDPLVLAHAPALLVGSDEGPPTTSTPTSPAPTRSWSRPRARWTWTAPWVRCCWAWSTSSGTTPWSVGSGTPRARRALLPGGLGVAVCVSAGAGR